MKVKTLRLADDLALPLDFATEGVGIVGMRGSGKSSTEVRWAEVLDDADVPFVAVDPKGDWWGIRSSGDGKGPGLSVPVFGGLHGDYPLLPHMGAQIANLLVDHMLSAVLDVSRLSISGRTTFLTAFCDQLMDRHQREPHVRSVVLEEAHRIIPQEVKGETARLKEAAAAILLEGRAWGLGCWAPTQRPARLHKDVLEEVGNFILFRIPLTARNDKRAIADWFRHHDLGDEILASLSDLPPGRGWFVAPSLGIVKLVQMHRRQTFDSGATPKVGASLRPPSKLADIDGAAITAALAQEIEKAKADDPRELRKQVTQLQRELAKVQGQREAELLARRELEEAPPRQVVERVEVPVLDEGLVVRLEEALSPFAGLLAEVQERLTWETRKRDESVEMERRLREPQPTPAERNAAAQAARERAERVRRDLALGVAEVPPRPARPPAPPGEAAKLSKGERLVLAALAPYYPQRRTRVQVAMVTGYASNGGGFKNILGALRTKGYIEGVDPMAATEAGLVALGDWEPLPTGRALAEHWLGQSKVLGRAGQEALRVLVDVWPGTLPTEEVAARSRSAKGEPYEAEGGGFKNGLSRLRTLQLIDGPRDALRASDDLMGE